MLSVEQAIDCIVQSVHGVEAEPVLLADALNRVLAEDIMAPEDLPRFPHATVDGFAIHRRDVERASENRGVGLAVIDTVSAGSSATKTVEPGISIRVMTGALLPPGTDAVVKEENTSPVGGQVGFVKIKRPVKRKEHIARAGESIRRGEIALSRGMIVRPERIGILASLGRQRVGVFRQPRIGLLATGQEVVALEDRLGPGKIVASSFYFLMAKLREQGCIPVDLGITGDDREDIQSRIRSGLTHDAIITLGGTGRGLTDWVGDVYDRMEIHRQFDGVAIRPGRSLRFGLFQGKPLFSLPGSPTACLVAFEELVMPAILRLRGVGEEDAVRPMLRMNLAGRLSGKRGIRRYVLARVVLQDGRLKAIPLVREHRGSVMPIMQANGIVMVPENRTEVPPGGEVCVRVLGLTI
jgi:molybdopterin molybdotransferase